MGRPPKDPSEKKVPKSVYLSPETLATLELIDPNASRAIEKLVAQRDAGQVLEKD